MVNLKINLRLQVKKKDPNDKTEIKGEKKILKEYMKK